MMIIRTRGVLRIRSVYYYFGLIRILQAGRSEMARLYKATDMDERGG